MRLIDEWKDVLLRAYSVHFWALSFVCGALDVLGNCWPLFAGLLPVPPLAFAILGLLFGIAGLIGRFIPQPKIKKASKP